MESTIKEQFVKKLIGTPMKEVRKRISRWWLCVSNHITCDKSYYTFTRVPCGTMIITTNRQGFITNVVAHGFDHYFLND